MHIRYIKSSTHIFILLKVQSLFACLPIFLCHTGKKTATVVYRFSMQFASRSEYRRKILTQDLHIVLLRPTGMEIINVDKRLAINCLPLTSYTWRVLCSQFFRFSCGDDREIFGAAVQGGTCSVAEVLINAGHIRKRTESNIYVL